MLRLIVATVFLVATPSSAQHSTAHHSIARQWNDVMLDAIRSDFARPTVHARNLFHASVAMYDMWAVYDPAAGPYMMGGDHCAFQGIGIPFDLESARVQAISHAVYGLLRHRFSDSPGKDATLPALDALMADLGLDVGFSSTDYSSGDPAALGNYMARCLIDFGLQDGANEADDYNSQYYVPVNAPLFPDRPGTPQLVDPNRWQPLTLEVFIDQGNNQLDDNTPGFLGPEWGSVTPFALGPEDLTIFSRDGNDFWVYHDPGDPVYLEEASIDGPNGYQWGFALVAAWSSHLDPTDGVMVDISPASLGNVQYFPRTPREYPDFYDFLDGGDSSIGWLVNPRTGMPYEPQMVPRGDYARVLAEFWADGPDSETPPGHWFTILNTVNDHPLSTRRFRGQDPELDPLEWDVKAYFALAGAVHDSAVAAWGIKGWYDYLRPISAIRSMADRGQSSDSSLGNYAPHGLPLVPGLIEVVEADDPMAGVVGQHVGKIKLYAWKGPEFIQDPDTDEAGVDWILAENWWPYQRPTFVTPPFAGYISGHSTFSRAAAEVMTMLTGDEYFPGGLGEFLAPKNEFLVFEEGPSQDIVLQWATYRDASDQTSLSRIWGGIHPPVDDLPGRILGERLGVRAFELAEQYFEGALVAGNEPEVASSSQLQVYPNPAIAGEPLTLMGGSGPIELVNILGQTVRTAHGGAFVRLSTDGLAPGLYFLRTGISGIPIILTR